MNEAPIKLREFERKAFQTQIWLVKLIDCETFFIKTFAGQQTFMTVHNNGTTKQGEVFKNLLQAKMYAIF